jgi:hypothetical protein
METTDSVSLTRRRFNLLLATNGVTLVALVATIVVLLNKPAPLPEPERMQQMIEAQDWLIGKMSEKLWKQNVELVKLKYGLMKYDPNGELEELLERIKQYDGTRTDWPHDLDDSRRRMEAGYQELVESAESSPSDPAPSRVPDIIPIGENDE